MGIEANAGTRSTGQIAWAPLNYNHDPDPPITLEDGTVTYSYGQEVLIYAKPSVGLGVLTIAVNLLLSTLAPADAAPFIPIDYPNPEVKTRFNGDWIQTRPLFAVDNSPLNQFNWPNPLLAKIKEQDWIKFKQLEVVGDSPFVPVNISLPLIKYRIGETWTANLLQSTLAPTGIAPFVPVTWTNPNKKGALITDVSSGIRVEPTTPPIFVQVTELYPPRKKRVADTWINPRPSYYVENLSIPFKSTVNINPAPKFRLITDISSSIQVPAGEVPLSRPVFANPLLKKRIRQDHEFYYVENIGVPPTVQITAVPLIKRKSTLTWLQVPLVASPITSIPPGKREFNLPLVEGKQNVGYIKSSFLSLFAVPFYQTEWPNPICRERRSVYDWIKEHPFYFEESIPSRQLDWPVPLVKKVLTRDHIFVAQINETNVLINLGYPNPLIKPVVVKTHLVNLLESTLFPGEGATPVGVSAYPNPALRKLITEDWIQYYAIDTSTPGQPVVPPDYPNPLVRKTRIDWKYFSSIAESLMGSSTIAVPLTKRRSIIDWINNSQENTLNPIPESSVSQKDWPNPLYKSRNSVGFTDDRSRFITGTLPFRFTEWPVPVKRRIAGSWTDNPIITIITPVGLKPFAQTEWPLVVRVRRGGQDYIQRAFILTSVTGRVICLLSDATEYQLESQLQDYDLESRFEIYEIESGGDECQ